MFDSLSDAQVALLAATFTKEAKARRASILPGEYSVDASTVDVPGGTVTVGQDEQNTPTVALPLLSVLTIALHRAGFQRDGILSLVTEAATEALSNGERVGTEIDTTVMYVAREIDMLRAHFAANLPKVKRAGKVKVKVG